MSEVIPEGANGTRWTRDFFTAAVRGEGGPMCARARARAARVLLEGLSMRSLSARLVTLMFAVLTLCAMAILPGCGATPDSAGGEGATTYEATVPTGDDGED